jgi:hypothetical protein
MDYFSSRLSITPSISQSTPSYTNRFDYSPQVSLHMFLPLIIVFIFIYMVITLLPPLLLDPAGLKSILLIINSSSLNALLILARVFCQYNQHFCMPLSALLKKCQICLRFMLLFQTNHFLDYSSVLPTSSH